MEQVQTLDLCLWGGEKKLKVSVVPPTPPARRIRDPPKKNYMCHEKSYPPSGSV